MLSRAAPLFAAAISIAAAACASAPPTALTRVELDRRFPAFPSELDAETRFFPAEDAAVVVVHIRQTHLPFGLTEGGVPDDAERADLSARIHAANESQRAIHGVLRCLAQRGWDRVFSEGEAVGADVLDQPRVAEKYVGALCRIDAVLQTQSPSLLQRYSRHGAAAIADDPVWDAVRFAPGADLLLALTGEIRLLPAEPSRLLTAAGQALRDKGVAAAAAFSDEREDAILAEVAARGNGAAVVLLGAAHDMSDNAARWNRAHADRRIALVVLTPR